jgi:hypothetical protein
MPISLASSRSAASASTASRASVSGIGIAAGEERPRLGSDDPGVEGERELFGGARVLLAPESEEGFRV